MTIKVGDLVVINSPSLVTYGKTGEVELVNGKNVKVRIKGTNRLNTYHVDNLERKNTPPKSNDKTKYIALIHFHDNGENPQNIEEAVKDFDNEELANAEMFCYGTKDKILSQIMESEEFEEFENCFIIMNNELYSVEKEVRISVNW